MFRDAFIWKAAKFNGKIAYVKSPVKSTDILPNFPQNPNPVFSLFTQNKLDSLYAWKNSKLIKWRSKGQDVFEFVHEKEMQSQAPDAMFVLNNGKSNVIVKVVNDQLTYFEMKNGLLTENKQMANSWTVKFKATTSQTGNRVFLVSDDKFSTFQWNFQNMQKKYVRNQILNL